ncbi:MAG: hypothetical protein K2M46_00945 [Lachnospiraceae bacterium]|nr:hypothetical protein [Lachnospiraceae bacterium]
MEDDLLLILLLFLIAIWLRRQQVLAVKRIWKRKQRKDDSMLRLAEEFVGKECMVYLMMSTQVTGIIKAIGENGILLEDAQQNQQILNLEYITRIREYPKNKKGKKRSIVVD